MWEVQQSPWASISSQGWPTGSSQGTHLPPFLHFYTWLLPCSPALLGPSFLGARARCTLGPGSSASSLEQPTKAGQPSGEGHCPRLQALFVVAMLLTASLQPLEQGGGWWG